MEPDTIHSLYAKPNATSSARLGVFLDVMLAGRFAFFWVLYGTILAMGVSLGVARSRQIHFHNILRSWGNEKGHLATHRHLLRQIAKQLAHIPKNGLFTDQVAISVSH